MQPANRALDGVEADLLRAAHSAGVQERAALHAISKRLGYVVSPNRGRTYTYACVCETTVAH